MKTQPYANKRSRPSDRGSWARFWRCYHLLHFIACRVLGGPERAEKAVENCWHAASRNPPHFEYAGAFRTWLVRVLIEEDRTEHGGEQPGVVSIHLLSDSLFGPKRSPK